MSLKSLVLLLLLGLPACATVGPATSQPCKASITPVAPPLSGIEHVVVRGETLWRISKTYRVDIEKILAHNKISDRTLISVGQRIYIPKDTQEPPQGPSTNFSNQEETGFIWPAQGKLIARFREKCNGVSNKGIDILTDSSVEVLASKPGRIIFSGELPGYGSTLIIDHGDNISTVYCGSSSIQVKVGDEVKQGMAIAKTGTPLRKNGGSLHFEIRKNHKPQNPLYYLN